MTKKENTLFASLFIIIIGNALFLSWNAFRCFNFHDMGSFLDASWRVSNGQRPYLDFIYHAGPVHLYLNAFFFKIFSFGKTALLAHLITVQSIVISAVFLALWRNVSFPITVLVTLLTGPAFYWPVSHPWHDQSAHLWGILVTVFLIRQIPFADKNRAFYSGLFCGVLAVLALLTKSNIGAAYALTLLIVFSVSGKRRQALSGYGLGLLASLLLSIFIVHSPKEFMEQSLTFSGAANRFSALLSLPNWFANYYWFILGIVALNAFPYYKKYPELITLFSGISFVGIFSVMTGAMIQSANISLWGIQTALAFICLSKIKISLAPSREKLYRLSLNILTCTTLLLTGLAIKYGYELKTWTYFQKNPEGDYVIKTKPLDGWKAPRFQGEPLDNLVKYINENIPAEASLLNLTDMYIIYALTNRESYRGIPFVFYSNQLPAEGQQARQVHERILIHPPDWILVNLDSSPVLQNIQIQEDIQARYLPVFAAGEYFLLEKNHPEK